MTKIPMNLFTLAREFDKLDHRKIAEWVAMNDSDLFVRAAEETHDLAPAGHPQWMLDCPKVCYPTGSFGPKALVSLIKHIREHAHLGLREAMLVARALTGGLTFEQWDDLNGPHMAGPLEHLAAIRKALGVSTF